MRTSELLLAVIRTALMEGAGALPETASKEQWEEVMEEMEKQAVLGMGYACCKKYGLLSGAKQTEYRKKTIQNITNHFGMAKEQETVIQTLQESGIPVIVLKGSAAAVYYPHPEQRMMGDIDLLTPPEYFEMAFHVLQKSGWKNKEAMQVEKRHNEFEKNGIELELHNRFATQKDPEKRELLDDLIWEGVRERIETEAAGARFWMLPHWINGLVLLCHAQYHMQEGIGLRHLIDWMMFVEKELDDTMWKQKFEPAAEQLGLKKFALVLTETGQRYLGLGRNVTWCSSTDDVICREMMDYIMQHGDFGKKDDQNRKRGDILLLLNHPVKYLAYAQEIGCRTWLLAEKYPFLKNIAWIYQSFRFIRHGSRQKISIGTFREDYQKAKQKRELFQHLEIENERAGGKSGE